MIRTALASIVAICVASAAARADDGTPHVPVQPPGTVFKPDDVLRAIGLGGQSDKGSSGSALDPKNLEGASELAKSLGGWLKDHPELAQSMAKPLMEMLAQNPDLLKAQPPEGIRKLMEDFAKSDAGKSLAENPDFQRQLNESGLKEKLQSLWPQMKEQAERGGAEGLSGDNGKGAGGAANENLMKMFKSLMDGNGKGLTYREGKEDGGSGVFRRGEKSTDGAMKLLDDVRKSLGMDGSKKGESKGWTLNDGKKSVNDMMKGIEKGIFGRRGEGRHGAGGSEEQAKLATETAESGRKLSEMVRKAIGDQKASDALKSTLDGINRSANTKPPAPTFGEQILPTKRMFGGLGDNMVSAATWATKTGKFISDKLGAIPRPSLPDSMSAPRFTPPSLSGLGPAFSAPSAETGKSLGVLLAVAAAVALGFWLLRKAPTDAFRAAIARSFRKPLDLAGLSERERVAKLFEHAAVAEIGESARPQNHRQAARELAQLKSGEPAAADELAQLYEVARYSPPQEPMAPNAGATAYGLLFRLNAAPKVAGEPASVGV